MLLPHFKTAGVNFRSIATASGVSAHDVGKRFGFTYAVSSAEEVLDEQDVNLVVVGTRHDLHASLAAQALRRNKHVFVEKPLALNDVELDDVLQAAAGLKREAHGWIQSSILAARSPGKRFLQSTRRPAFYSLSHQRRPGPERTLDSKRK